MLRDQIYKSYISLDKVSSIWGKIGRKIQFSFQYLFNCFFPTSKQIMSVSVAFLSEVFTYFLQWRVEHQWACRTWGPPGTTSPPPSRARSWSGSPAPCTLWCRRRCESPCSRQWTPCIDRSLWAWHDPERQAECSQAWDLCRWFPGVKGNVNKIPRGWNIYIPVGANALGPKLFLLHKNMLCPLKYCKTIISGLTSKQRSKPKNIPSLSRCIKSSPPLRYSRIKYSFPFV